MIVHDTCIIFYPEDILAGMSPHRGVPASNISPPGYPGSPSTMQQQMSYGQPVHHSPQGIQSPRQVHTSPAQYNIPYGSPPIGYTSPQRAHVPLNVHTSPVQQPGK